MARYSTLFNPITIKKLCSKQVLTDAQRKAANEWLELLEGGKLAKEKQHYFDFGITILHELLGYPVKTKDGMSHEEGNVEFIFSNESGEKIVCFEAKGADVKDLFAPQHRVKKEHETPIKQTWDYMGTNNLEYGICTNYKSFVLIDKKWGLTKYYKFDFESIKNNDEKLKEFIAIFSKHGIIDTKFVEELKQKSLTEERELTNEFYKLFHETRLMLIKEFQINASIREPLAVHYAQLYLNRLIFSFFAKDNNLIPKRIFTEKTQQAVESPLISEHSHLVSDTIRVLFESLDKGSRMLRIFGFNGGLFSEEIPSYIFFKDMREMSFFSEIYKNSKLKKTIELDEISKRLIRKYKGLLNPLISNLLLMDSFDFSSQVNVSILGHIFEQSLTDLEEFTGNKDSKRKKDGIFYTPEYITDYICRNTIIPYLSKKGVTNTDDLISEYANDIELLGKKIKEVKIIDPSCGSGAFLIKAAEILLEIDKKIQDFKNPGIPDQLQLKTWSEQSEITQIIESNVFGVDLNEESVEITKLSLYLKIAAGDKKLINLSSNIRVGNSVIDNSVIAGNKAFSWDENFKTIIDQGGFDIVIGNPPYVKARDQILTIEERNYIEKKFVTCHGMWDLYVPFMELGLKLLKKGGVFAMIIKDTLGEVDYTSKLVEFIESNYNLYQIDFFPGIAIFGNQVGVENKIVFINNSDTKTEARRVLHSPDIMDLKILENQTGIKKYVIKIAKQEINTANTMKLGEICFVSYGLRLNSDKEDKESKFKKEDLLSEQRTEINNRVYTEGKYLEDYAIIRELYVEWGTERCPKRLVRATFPELYDQPKLLMSRQKRVVAYSDQKHICDNTIIVGILAKDLATTDNGNIRKYYKNLNVDRKQIEANSKEFDLKYILAIINSTLIGYFIKYNSEGRFDTYPDDWKKIPIKQIPISEQKSYALDADSLILLNKELSQSKKKFLSIISSEFPGLKITGKLNEFHKLTLEQFFKEIENNSKTILSLTKKDELAEYFNKYKNNLNSLRSEIQSIKINLNKKIYDLYEIDENQQKEIEDDLNTST